jgi:hypothetical protein
MDYASNVGAVASGLSTALNSGVSIGGFTISGSA